MGGSAEKYTLESAVPLRYELMLNRPSGTRVCLPVDAYRRSHTRNAVNANTKTTSTPHLRGSSSGDPVVKRNGHMSDTTLIPNSTSPTGSSESGLPDGCRVTGRNQMARAMAAS